MKPEDILAGRKVPGLTPDEAEYLRRYLRLGLAKYIDITTNVRVGEGIPTKAQTPELEKAYQELTKKRIDAVGETEKEIHILDFSDRLTARHLGQLLIYKELYTKEYKPTKKVRPIAVSEEITPEMREIFTKYGVDTVKI
jgi:hypothetical protein